MSIIIPVKGNPAFLSKRNRTMPAQRRALNTVAMPKTYIFNVGAREWVKALGNGRYVIPACDKGAEVSRPLVFDALVLSEMDLGDGAGNMGCVVDPARSGFDEEGNFTEGVAEDIIGSRSTSAALDLFTTNLEWFGVFATANAEPTKEEIAGALAKQRQMMQLIYAKGSELVQSGEKVSMLDRKNYNEAAEFLGARPLWGDQEHLMARCPECLEPIIEGATFCKHCSQPVDAASVAARARRRDIANKKALQEAGEEATA